MNALQLLTDDHDQVRGLFDDFRAAEEDGDTAKMHALQETIFEELDTHAQIEEDIFYPTLRELGIEDLTEIVAEGIQEHHVVKVLMREVEPLKDEEIFVAKMTVLIENVEHHADEEESDMFPKVRKNMTSEQLDELGAALEAAKANH